MKKTLFLLILIGLITSCASNKKMLQRGNYDRAIQKSVKILMKNPNKSEDAAILDKAYRLANERDLARIRFLKTENNPDNWDEIYMLYSRLNNRQNMVRPVMPLNIDGRTVQYDFVDYDAMIVTAKDNAAQFYYDNAMALMGNNDKESYRQAYAEFLRAKDYSATDFPGIEEKIREARYKGISRALVQVVNESNLNLSPRFEDELLAINTSVLNSEWVEYHLRHVNEDIDYDYMIYVVMKSFDVSPDNVRENDKMYEKKVEDGFEYVLDQNGNVMKDSLGNDIRIPRYKTLTCTVIETEQYKSAVVRGEMEFHSLNPKALLKRLPVSAENIFEHVSARAVGDPEALDPTVRRRVQTDFIPFPNDMEMIISTTETLKPAIQEALLRNRHLVQ